MTAGLRLDDIGGSDRADDPRNSGNTNEALLSPKFTAAWRLSPKIELYADAGQGFHSNDFRGSTISVVPGSPPGAGATPADRIKLFAKSQGAELGARYSDHGLTATASLWTLHLDSELVYNGDGGDTASTGATQRTGVEFLVTYTPTSKLDFNFSAAASDAHYVGHPAGGDRIPNALEYVLTGGVTARITPRTVVTITGRSLGPAPLIEDNSARSRTSTLFNGLVDHNFGRFKVKLEVLNLFDSRGDEIRYFYTSRLNGEASFGADDYHFHAFEPRTFRIALRAPL